MDQYQVGSQTTLIERFVLIANREDEGIYQSFNKLIYPNVPLSGSSFGTFPEFAFPDSKAIMTRQDRRLKECYFFALTKGPGQHQFAVCKRLYPPEKEKSSFPVCICIISLYPWFDLLQSLLEKLEVLFSTNFLTFSDLPSVIPFLDELLSYKPYLLNENIINISLPSTPGLLVPIEHTFSYIRPSDTSSYGLPSLHHFVRALSSAKLIAVWSALVLERRVIIHSNDLVKLSQFIFGVVSLLYPMEWPHIFIPLLCASAISYCAAPMPFLIGVHSSLLDEVNSLPLEEITFVNLDSGMITAEHDDSKIIPLASSFALTSSIDTEKQRISSKKPIRNELLRNAFTSFWLGVLYNCNKYIKPTGEDESSPHIFNDKEFLRCAPAPTRAFLETFCRSQMFAQFIHHRQDSFDNNIPWKTPFDIASSKLEYAGQAAVQQYLTAVSTQGLDILLQAPNLSAPKTPNAIPAVTVTSAVEIPRALPPRPRLSGRPEPSRTFDDMSESSQDSSSPVNLKQLSSSTSKTENKSLKWNKGNPRLVGGRATFSSGSNELSQNESDSILLRRATSSVISSAPLPSSKLYGKPWEKKQDCTPSPKRQAPVPTPIPEAPANSTENSNFWRPHTPPSMLIDTNFEVTTPPPQEDFVSVLDLETVTLQPTSLPIVSLEANRSDQSSFSLLNPFANRITTEESQAAPQSTKHGELQQNTGQNFADWI